MNEQLLLFPTCCSAHRSPRIPERPFFEMSDVLFCAQEFLTVHYLIFPTFCSAPRRPGAHVILAQDLLDLHGSISLAWVYKTSARKVDKRPTLNTAPARSVIKKRGPGPGPWARSRTGPGPARTSYLHGSTRLAWVYKSSMGPLDLPGSISLAWVYKSSVGL